MKLFLFLLLLVSSVQAEEHQYDIAIIGDGCAGLGAGLVLADYDYKTIVLTGPQMGGNLNVKTVVSNWPGRTTVNGKEILKAMKTQVKNLGLQEQNVQVVSCDFHHYPFRLGLSDHRTISARTVLIATGTNERKLGVKGFSEYWGKGIWSNEEYYKDDLKPFLEVTKGQTVLIIGGGLDAFRKAVYAIRGGVKKVIIAVRGDQMRLDHRHQRDLSNYKEIEVLYKTEVVAFKGNGSVLKSVVLKNGKGEYEIPLENVVLSIGRVPNSALCADEVEINESGSIVLQQGTQETSVPGVFAAGDVTTNSVYGQGAIAAGDGMKAAYEILTFLDEKEKKTKSPK